MRVSASYPTSQQLGAHLPRTKACLQRAAALLPTRMPPPACSVYWDYQVTTCCIGFGLSTHFPFACRHQCFRDSLLAFYAYPPLAHVVIHTSFPPRSSQRLHHARPPLQRAAAPLPNPNPTPTRPTANTHIPASCCPTCHAGVQLSSLPPCPNLHARDQLLYTCPSHLLTHLPRTGTAPVHRRPLPATRRPGRSGR